jgi:FixJ family two-component response regulator
MMPDIESAQSGVERQGAPVIYLVDDDPSFLRALSRRLRAEGYEVECFDSVEEFLRRRRSDIPGCAVLDLQMPGPGGLELQETLAQADDPLPVVFLTAHGDVPSSVRAMKGGAVDFLRKPVRGDDLLNAIRLALARGAALREKRRQNGVLGTNACLHVSARFLCSSCVAYRISRSPTCWASANALSKPIGAR